MASRIEYILPGIPKNEITWDQARYMLCDGDVLLWLPRDLTGNLIARGTNGPFCHVSMVAFAWGSPFQGGYHQVGDGALSLLRHEVQQHSGKISVFRVDGLGPHEGRTAAAFAMNGLSGSYASENIALIALAQSYTGRLLGLIPPVKRWWLDRARLRSRSRSSAICSQNVHRAYRDALQIELVPGKQESLVSPNDLAHSTRMKYICTLTWPQEWRRAA